MRVLVVGTNRMCHDRLRDLGHEMVLFVPRGRARREDAVGPYRHVVVLDDQAAPEDWVGIARVLHRGAPFDAVVAYNEHTYRIVRAVSDALDVPTVVDVELFGRVLDKARMRELLEKHGIPSCRHRYARGRDAVLAAVEEIGLPCIVKPVDGEASEGVARIESAAELDAALLRVGARHLDRGVLVEEFLVGPEYSVEALSVGSRHHVVAVTRKFSDHRTFVERGHLVPAPLDATDQQAVVAYTTRVLDAFGFHDCPSHTELVLTERGPRIIETHNRIGGDSIMDLVRLATGVDMYDLVARQSLGQDVTALLPDPVAHRQSAAVWFADPDGPTSSTLLEVRGVDGVRGLPHVHRLELLKEPGSPLTPVRQSSDRSALAITVGATPKEALARAREAIGSLRFVYAWTPAEPLG
ncbi:biotin carboxylase [Kitasatospora sp. GP30]|uniref:ATP-grasp domain-containing protein n=1 Tax=Kitasatospora sp. GP30 TaxID=3035084 RepID=UPI000C707C3E|nr:ATP-grasp domain-containing protein [Kitasatospora sp. GP30]MDH6139940.1 biotin carboxylase [Kitasatospora sp. GP30]